VHASVARDASLAVGAALSAACVSGRCVVRPARAARLRLADGGADITTGGGGAAPRRRSAVQAERQLAAAADSCRGAGQVLGRQDAGRALPAAIRAEQGRRRGRASPRCRRLARVRRIGMRGEEADPARRNLFRHDRLLARQVVPDGVARADTSSTVSTARPIGARFSTSGKSAGKQSGA
jgi:hypothetical protein